MKIVKLVLVNRNYMNKTEEFIEKAKRIHGDYFDYSKVDYKNAKTNVTIICPKHGEFLQTPSNHLMGHGCRKCTHKGYVPIGGTRLNKEFIKDTESFINKAIGVHGNKYDYSKADYINSSEKVCIICPEHGEFWQLPTQHCSGQGCPECGKLSKSSKHTKSKEELESRFREVHGERYDYDWSEYKNQRTPVNVFCRIHKLWFPQAVQHHLDGHGCALCSCKGRKYTTEEFIIRAKEVHGNLYDYSNVNYINKETPVEIICSKHGSFWQKPHNHINGCGCQKCKATKTQYRIFEFLQEKYPDEVWEWEYSPDWLGVQRFDIYNAKHNLAIEYNGEQHYLPIEIFGGESEFQKRLLLDENKEKLCKENNCTLYIIKYNELDYNKLKDDIFNILSIKNNETS